MLGYLGLVALDVANEKAREAEAQAERWRLSRLVALQGGGPPRASGAAPAAVASAAVQRRVVLGERGGLRGRVTPGGAGRRKVGPPPGWRTSCTTSPQSPGDPIASTCSGSTADRVLWHRASTGRSGEPQSLGGTLASTPAVTAWGVDQLEVFAVFDDGALWDRDRHGTAWAARGSRSAESFAVGATPAASSWGPDRLDVFAAGTDGSTWHRWWDGSRWVEWEQLPA